MLLIPLLCSIAFAPLASAPKVTVAKTDTHLHFHFGEKLLTSYHYAGQVQLEKTTGSKPLAKPYFWPINAPNGTCVTRSWPMLRDIPKQTTDHFHQKSAWFCHGDVIPEWLTLQTKSADRRVGGVDFWSESPGHGWQICKSIGEAKISSDELVQVVTTNEWQTPDHVKILDEERIITCISKPEGTLIVLDCRLTASQGPVRFGDTKEGSMGIRVHDDLRAQVDTKAVITSSNGKSITAPSKDNLPIWGRPADWHDYSGVLNGNKVGIALFDHPQNSQRANWHTRAYGLMSANPFAREKSGFPAQKGNKQEFRLEKNDAVRLVYAIYVHQGDVQVGKVAETYQLFAGMK